MDNLEWFEGYNEQTLDELIELEGKYRTDSLICAIEEALQNKAYEKGMESLSPEELIVLAIEAFEREVNNGGYLQFFSNESREFAPMIVEFLDRIGCPRTAKLSEEALNALGMDDSITVDAILEAVGDDNAERDSLLEDCDQRFYSEVNEDIAGQLLEFVKQQREKIALK